MPNALYFLNMFKRGKRYHNLTKTEQKEPDKVIQDLEKQ